jgi:hypothetical protein
MACLALPEVGDLSLFSAILSFQAEKSRRAMASDYKVKMGGPDCLQSGCRRHKRLLEKGSNLSEIPTFPQKPLAAAPPR